MADGRKNRAQLLTMVVGTTTEARRRRALRRVVGRLVSEFVVEVLEVVRRAREGALMVTMGCAPICGGAERMIRRAMTKPSVVRNVVDLARAIKKSDAAVNHGRGCHDS